jgi:hypothetical protein
MCAIFCTEPIRSQRGASSVLKIEKDNLDPVAGKQRQPNPADFVGYLKKGTIPANCP